MFGKIGTKVRSWRKYHETYGELMQLTNRELDDIGITRGDIPHIARQHSR